MNRQRLGTEGEMLALKALQKKKMKCVAKNYRALRMEIDLIMQDGDTTVFVEVKARHTDRYGLGREAVTKVKQAHLIKAALAYMSEHDLHDAKVRFDVVEISLSSGKTEHIPNAFSQ